MKKLLLALLVLSAGGFMAEASAGCCFSRKSCRSSVCKPKCKRCRRGCQSRSECERVVEVKPCTTCDRIVASNDPLAVDVIEETFDNGDRLIGLEPAAHDDAIAGGDPMPVSDIF